MIGFLSLLFQASTLAAPVSDEPPRCARIDDTTISLSGAIDAAMADCFHSALSPATRELVVDTGGGDISIAMDMAEAIQPLGLTIRVRGRCYSSCANYLIPAARRLVVEDRGAIVLHGGADPLLLKTDVVDRRAARIREFRRNPGVDRAEAQRRYDRAVETVQALVERQRSFATRIGIGPGWLLYREPGDRGFGRYLSGQGGDRPHPFGWKFMLAEERLVRTCLPNLEVEPFQDRLLTNFINDADRFGRFRRSQGLRSDDLACTASAAF